MFYGQRGDAMPTDEIKERLKEYIPEYAKYTMVASNKLGQRAVDRQNELLRNLLGMEELT